GFVIFLATQFVIGKFMGGKQQDGGSSKPGDMPAFEDRPAPAEMTDYNPVPNLVMPLWPDNSALDINVYLSPSVVVPGFSSFPEGSLVLDEKNFTMGNYSDTRE